MNNAKMLMYDLTTDDKQLCIALLKNVEMKFSSLWPQHKGKSFEEVFSSIVIETSDAAPAKKSKRNKIAR
jgi:hypothetical protein